MNAYYSKKPDWFTHHEEDDERNFGALGGDVREIRDDIKGIKENHLAHIQIAMERQSGDLSWIKWLVMSTCAGVGTIITALIIYFLTRV